MPVISAADFTALLRAHDFARLFGEHLGWDNVPRNTPNVQLNAPGATGPEPFVFQPVKVKHGFMVLSCPALPTKAQRQRLSLQMSKRYAEHLLVYAPTATGEAGQLWQLVTRDPGEPVRYFEFLTNTSDQREGLRRRVEELYFDFEQEAAGKYTTISSPRGKVRRAFAILNAEKVTKKFYAEFSRQHQAFQAMIKGIEGSADRAWYTSIMLNRLMFIYFVQAQGYLLVQADGPTEHDKDYLDFKRKQCAELLGPDKFESFYRSFLRVLFSEGLNAPLPHAPALAALLGRVPYLNGGLFEEHELERAHPAISIPDQAFENLFGFLSKWDWILDSRPKLKDESRLDAEAANHRKANGTINPDVIGYIFERYINERAQMGAYYTKEDITEYIAKNCLIPALFDRMSERGARHESEVWDLLQDYPDRYLYPAQRKGLDLPLPPDIEAGRTDMAARAARWNRPTPNDGPDDYGLPTEIWRETIQRRDRTTAARTRLLSGQVRSINELITLNLDLRQFLHDAIANAGNAEWVWACFESLRSLSILDPTCGSGAFLFAALRLLEPLYQDCLDRMEAFLPELDNPKALRVKKEVVRGMHQVRRELVENHLDNRAYFITKTIILHNLYGVDLMHEAVEIAKLRLFLQLMSTLGAPDYTDANLGLEPLPDVDFNIRAGNTLVGFATEKELDGYAHLDFGGELEGIKRPGGEIAQIKKHAKSVAADYADFQAAQTGMSGTSIGIAAAKGRLKTGLDILKGLCNELLNRGRVGSVKDFERSHQPFHWFAEFYEIITKKGGFDIVIGNPPYLEYADVKETYKLSDKDYSTFSCGNLYAYTWERALKIGEPNARTGMIIPVASVCTDRYANLQKLLHKTGTSIISNFNDRPSKLFENLEHIRLSIILHQKGKGEKPVLSSKYYKWQSTERANLFEQLSFTNTTKINLSGAIAKIGSEIESSLIDKIKKQKKSVVYFALKSGTVNLYYTRKLSNYVQVLDFIPEIRDMQNNLRLPTELKKYTFLDLAARDCFLALFNSSLFFYLITVYSDCRNLNKRELEALLFDFDSCSINIRSQLQVLSSALMTDINTNSQMVQMGALKIQCTFPKLSKPIIDEIDKVLAVHYGFTDEELDFIINYDIKYRMGAELNAD